MNVETLPIRYFNGELALGLYTDEAAFTALVNQMTNGQRPLSWPDLCAAHRKVLEAALRAGYKAAVADMKATLGP